MCGLRCARARRRSGADGRSSWRGVAAPRITADSISEAVEVARRRRRIPRFTKAGALGRRWTRWLSQLERRFEKEVAGLKGERVVGVIVAYGDEVAWSDIFASPELFNHYWMKLLRSYSVEALARPKVREVATRGRCARILAAANGKQIEESEPNVYRWREITEGRLALIELDALMPKADDDSPVAGFADVVKFWGGELPHPLCFCKSGQSVWDQRLRDSRFGKWRRVRKMFDLLGFGVREIRVLFGVFGIHRRGHRVTQRIGKRDNGAYGRASWGAAVLRPYRIVPSGDFRDEFSKGSDGFVNGGMLPD